MRQDPGFGHLGVFARRPRQANDAFHAFECDLDTPSCGTHAFSMTGAIKIADLGAGPSLRFERGDENDPFRGDEGAAENGIAFSLRSAARRALARDISAAAAGLWKATRRNARGGAFLLAAFTMILSGIAGIVCLFLGLIGPGSALLVIAVIAFSILERQMGIDEAQRQMRFRDLMRGGSGDTSFSHDEEPADHDAVVRREAFFSSLAAVDKSPTEQSAERAQARRGSRRIWMVAFGEFAAFMAVILDALAVFVS